MNRTMNVAYPIVILLLLLSTVVQVTDCCSSRLIGISRQPFGHKPPNNTPTPNKSFTADKSLHGNEDHRSLDGDDGGGDDDDHNTSSIVHDASNNDGFTNGKRPTESTLEYRPPLRTVEHFQLMISTQCAPAYDLHYCLNGGRCFSYQIANYSNPSCECAQGFFGERCESKYLSASYYESRTVSLANIHCMGFAALISASFIILTCHYRCSKKILKSNFQIG